MPSKNGKPIVTRLRYSCIECGKPVYRHGKTKMCRKCHTQALRDDADERIFAAIVAYKRKHDGLAPAKSKLAKLAFVAQFTAYEAIQRLVAAGRIKLVHHHHYVGIIVVGGRWTYEEPNI